MASIVCNHFECSFSLQRFSPSMLARTHVAYVFFARFLLMLIRRALFNPIRVRLFSPQTCLRRRRSTDHVVPPSLRQSSPTSPTLLYPTLLLTFPSRTLPDTKSNAIALKILTFSSRAVMGAWMEVKGG